MPAFFYYLVKVLVCSGLFYAYYFFALRNKKIHLFNRYYLLSAAALSWIIPLLRLPYFEKPMAQPPPVVRILQVVAGGGRFLEEGAAGNQGHWDWTIWITGISLVLSFFFLARLLVSLSRVAWLIRVSPRERHGTATLVFSDAGGTPFSFFNYIFWNNAIAIDSPEGQRIFRHEWAHARGRHSLDRLFLHFLLIIGWYNPFLWLLLRELNMVHEFLADEAAVEDGDVSSLAILLLTSAFPEMRSSELAHGFFHSPVERRVGMITRQRPGYLFIRRWSILPLLGIMVLLFAFRTKDNPAGNLSKRSKRQYTVILDAGHGGRNSGSVSTILQEKDVNLRIARQIKTLNNDPDLNLLLTRTGDQDWSPQERVRYTAAHKADLFISIHTNSVARNSAASGGADICLSRKEGPYTAGSRLFASYLADKLKDLFKGEISVVQKTETITVLDANKTCPAILVECGYLPAGSVLGPERESVIAKRILEAVDAWFATSK